MCQYDCRPCHCLDVTKRLPRAGSIWCRMSLLNFWNFVSRPLKKFPWIKESTQTLQPYSPRSSKVALLLLQRAWLANPRKTMENLASLLSTIFWIFGTRTAGGSLTDLWDLSPELQSQSDIKAQLYSFCKDLPQKRGFGLNHPSAHFLCCPRCFAKIGTTASSPQSCWTVVTVRFPPKQLPGSKLQYQGHKQWIQERILEKLATIQIHLDTQLYQHHTRKLRQLAATLNILEFLLLTPRWDSGENSSCSEQADERW